MEKNYKYWETHKKILSEELSLLDDVQCFFFMRDPNSQMGVKISKSVDSKLKKILAKEKP